MCREEVNKLNKIIDELKIELAEVTHRAVTYVAEIKMWQKEVNKLEDQRLSTEAADAHRMYWELKAEKMFSLLKGIAELHCYRKKLGAPCHKALPKEEWCAVCFARNYMDKEGNPWQTKGTEAP